VRENSPGRKNGHANQEVQARANRDVASTDRSGTSEREDDTASLQRGGDTRAELLPLAEMIGTTRTRVNFFMNKFKKLGFIRYKAEIHVHKSLLSVLLND
jgi:hypothetical protein